MNQSGDIDQFDLKILRELSVNGRITVTELAGKVGLTKTPISPACGGSRRGAISAATAR